MAVALLALVCAACAPTGPPLETCRWGRYYADCGGNGDPVPACSTSTGECRWFLGGLLADGYLAATCPPERLCCVPSGSHTWAFEGWRPSGAAESRAEYDVEVLAATVVTPSSPPGVPVTLDYTEVPSGVSTECTAPSSLCALSHVARERSGESLVITLGNPGYLEVAELEVWPAPDGLRARAFSHRLPPPDAPNMLSCNATGVPFELVGSLRLSPTAFDDPENAHGLLDVDVSYGGIPITHWRFEF